MIAHLKADGDKFPPPDFAVTVCVEFLFQNADMQKRRYQEHKTYYEVCLVLVS